MPCHQSVLGFTVRILELLTGADLDWRSERKRGVAMDVGSGRGRSYRGARARVLATIALLLLVSMGFVASPAAASPCGDPGQRACCNGFGEFSNCGTACNSRARIVAGCSGDCDCPGGGGIITTGDHCEAVS